MVKRTHVKVGIFQKQLNMSNHMLSYSEGDSGGPMVSEGSTGSMEIVGIVSWGRGCARKLLPGIYTRVVNYLPWIQANINDECMCQPRTGQRTNYLENLMNQNNV